MAVDLISKLTSYTKYYGVVNISGVRSGVTRFANSAINQSTNKSDISITLTLHDGKKEATCTTNVLDDCGLKKLAKDTEDLLAISPNSEYDMIPWQRQPMRVAQNDKDLPVIYNAAGRADAIKEGINSLGSGFTAAGALVLEKKLAAYGNSFSTPDEILFADLNNVQFNTVVTNSANIAGPSECISHRFGGLDISGAFTRAQNLASICNTPITIDGGEYTVILAPGALADLIGYIVWSLNAKRVVEDLSFCGANLKKNPTLGANIRVYDDVNDVRVFPWYFDYEGCKRRTLPLIEKGIVKNLLFDSKVALLMGARQTGHAINNKGHGGFSLHTIMLGGDKSEEEMIKNTERGLYISELHYTNFVDPHAAILTGLTRGGSFLIENGKISRAIHPMRFTQNLLTALNNVTALSKNLTVVNAGGWAAVMPFAKIERFCFP